MSTAQKELINKVLDKWPWVGLVLVLAPQLFTVESISHLSRLIAEDPPWLAITFLVVIAAQAVWKFVMDIRGKDKEERQARHDENMAVRREHMELEKKKHKESLQLQKQKLAFEEKKHEEEMEVKNKQNSALVQLSEAIQGVGTSLSLSTDKLKPRSTPPPANVTTEEIVITARQAMANG